LLLVTMDTVVVESIRTCRPSLIQNVSYLIMVISNNLVDTVELTKWPKKIPMKFIPYVGEIFYETRYWKLVDRNVAAHDILRKGEQSVFHDVRNALLVISVFNFAI
jgi:hypothetical protein